MVGTYQEKEKDKPKPCIIINEEHVIDVKTGQPPAELHAYKKLMSQGWLPIYTFDDSPEARAATGMSPSNTFAGRKK
jgi:hypothetical protein